MKQDSGSRASRGEVTDRPEHFTPGPWEVERHDQDDGSIEYEIWCHSLKNYTRICSVSDVNDDMNAKNNARVMAAAPVMVQALIEAEEALQDYVDVRDGPDGHQHPNAAMRALHEVRDALDKALRPLTAR